MIARIFLLVVLASAFLEGDCKRGEKHKKMKENFLACKNESGLSDESAKEMWKGDVVDTPEGHKMYLCMAEKKGIMNDKGEVTDKCEVYAGKAEKIVPECVDELKKCCEEARKDQAEDKKGKTAFTLRKCANPCNKKIIEKKKEHWKNKKQQKQENEQKKEKEEPEE